MKPVSLTTYATQLRNHDWTYAFSDDHRAYCRGRDNQEYLRNMSEASPDHDALYRRLSCLTSPLFALHVAGTTNKGA